MKRLYLPDISVHVIRRGNNRGPIFGDDSDRQLFLGLLEVTADGRGVDVHGYAMMSNHYHLVVTPRTEKALPLMMRDLGREYVLRYNRKYGRIGTLWAGRYRSIPRDGWLAALTSACIRRGCLKACESRGPRRAQHRRIS